MPGGATMRIGELARRTGVSPELLRAWERRYGLLRPARTQGGFRLYSVEDEQRIVAMRALLADGLSAAEAARVALARVARDPGPSMPAGEASVLLDALLAFDDVRAQAAFDRLLADFGVETVLRDAVFPILREVGDRWVAGDVSIAQEHFASNLLRGRILGLARGWDRGFGPRARAPPVRRGQRCRRIARRQRAGVTSSGRRSVAWLVAVAPPGRGVVAASGRLAAVADELSDLAQRHLRAVRGGARRAELTVRSAPRSSAEPSPAPGAALASRTARPAGGRTPSRRAGPVPDPAPAAAVE